MENVKPKVCIICLELSEEWTDLTSMEMDMLQFLHLEMNKLVYRSLVICSYCSKTLQKCYEFKNICMNKHNYYVKKDTTFCSPFSIPTELHLKVKIEEICSFCLENSITFSTNLEEDSVIKDAIFKSFPKKDICLSGPLLFCPTCEESLKDLCRFITMLTRSNTSINKYVCLSVSTNDIIREIDLFDVYKSKLNAQRDTYDCNLDLMKVKVEKDENCNDSYNDEYIYDASIKEEECNLITIEEMPLDSVKEEINSNNFQNKLSETEKKYICYLCNFQTNVKATLVSHFIIHRKSDEVQKFQCELCDFKTKWRTSLNTHKLLHKDLTEVVMSKCDKCSYQSKYRKHLKRHMERHSSKKYYCEDCPFKSKNLASFKNHNKREHNKKVDLCYEKLDGEPIRIKMDKTKKSYRCSYCTYETVKQYRLKEHVVKHLSKDEVPLYSCSLCPFESKHRASKNHHQKMHTKGFVKPRVQFRNKSCGGHEENVEKLKSDI